MPEPRVSIVVPTHNNRGVLRETLLALGAQGEGVELVVVDDGSTDGTADMVQGLSLSVPLKIIRQANRGRAAARNAGAAQAAGRVLLFLDADMRPTPHLIAAHLRHHQDGANVGVQGAVIPDPGALTDPFMRATHLLPDLSPRRAGNLFPLHVSAGNFSLPNRTFRRIGGFDERFSGYGWEDVDLALRLRAAGVRLRYDPHARVSHRHVEDLAGQTRKYYQAGIGALYLWQKHERRPWLGVFLEIHPALLPWKWLLFRTGALTRLVEWVRPWAERRRLLPLCAECYNHLRWRAYYNGVFAAIGAGASGETREVRGVPRPHR